MTDLEKRHISDLREKGFSYQSIADATGISLGSIKMYFQRKKEPSETVPRCEQCSKPLRQDIVRIGRRFCSDICRVNWWTAHPRKLRDHSCTCPSCGKVFSPENQENSVPACVITLQGGAKMSDYDLLHYHAAIAQGHVMLERGLITAHEFWVFEEKMREKYDLPRNSIYRDKRLLYRNQ